MSETTWPDVATTLVTWLGVALVVWIQGRMWR